MKNKNKCIVGVKKKMHFLSDNGRQKKCLFSVGYAILLNLSDNGGQMSDFVRQINLVILSTYISCPTKADKRGTLSDKDWKEVLTVISAYYTHF